LPRGRPSKEAKPRGRPPKEAEAVKSATLSVRLLPDLRSKLNVACFETERSISEEVESRLMDSLTDDLIKERLGDFYGLVRAYLQTLAKRIGGLAKYELQKHVSALNVGFELIILAAFKGSLPEERVRQFWIHDIAKLRRDGGTEAANIAIDAFTTLTLAGLASIDPLALSQWMKDEAEKSS
jgi:hypothetical protein